MSEYKIVGKKATKVGYYIIFGIVVYHKATDLNYMFACYDGKTIQVSVLPTKNVEEDYKTWIYVGEFTSKDYEELPNFVEAIKEFFKNFKNCNDYIKSFKWEIKINI